MLSTKKFGQILLTLALVALMSCKPAAENSYSILDKVYSKTEQQSDLNSLVQKGLVHKKEMPDLKVYLDIIGRKSEGKTYKELLLELRAGDSRPLEILSAMDYKRFLDNRANTFLPGASYEGLKERASIEFGGTLHDGIGYEFTLEPTFNSKVLRVTYKPKYAEHLDEMASQGSDTGLKNYLVYSVLVSICSILMSGQDEYQCAELRQDQQTQDVLAHLFGAAVAQDFAEAKLVFVSDDYLLSYFEGDHLYLNDHQLKASKAFGPVSYDVYDRPLLYEGQRFGYAIRWQHHNLEIYEKHDFFEEINKLARNAQFINRIVVGDKAESNVSCYELGRKYAKCSALAFEGLKCPAEDDILLPVRCHNHEDTLRGMKDGFGSVLKQ